jgi:hypothetical protein
MVKGLHWGVGNVWGGEGYVRNLRHLSTYKYNRHFIRILIWLTFTYTWNKFTEFCAFYIKLYFYLMMSACCKSRINVNKSTSVCILTYSVCSLPHVPVVVWRTPVCDAVHSGNPTLAHKSFYRFLSTRRISKHTSCRLLSLRIHF